MKVKYEFVLDTQFISQNELTYAEIIMIKEVIDVLETNKELAISKLRKWTLEEYNEDIRLKEEQRELMIEALKKAFLKRKD